MKGMPFHEFDQRIETQVFLLVKQSLQIDIQNMKEGLHSAGTKLKKVWKKYLDNLELDAKANSELWLFGPRNGIC